MLFFFFLSWYTAKGKIVAAMGKVSLATVCRYPSNKVLAIEEYRSLRQSCRNAFTVGVVKSKDCRRQMGED